MTDLGDATDDLYVAPGFNGETDASYWDYKIGVTKTWDGGWNAGVFYVGASNDAWEKVASFANSSTKDLNNGRFIVQVGRSFRPGLDPSTVAHGGSDHRFDGFQAPPVDERAHVGRGQQPVTQPEAADGIARRIDEGAIRALLHVESRR